MEITRREILYEGKYLRMVKRHFKTDTGESDWETVERKNIHGKGAVVVIALTKEKEMILLTPTRATHFFAPKVEFVGRESREMDEKIEVLRELALRIKVGFCSRMAKSSISLYYNHL